MFLGIDYGDRYIGLAITEPDGTLAHRLGVIDQKDKNGIDGIRAIVDRERITHIIVGMPISFSGEPTEQTRKTRVFIEMLGPLLGNDIRIEAFDEAMTSLLARKQIRQEGKNLDEAHAEAARIILSNYLSSRESLSKRMSES